MKGIPPGKTMTAKQRKQENIQNKSGPSAPLSGTASSDLSTLTTGKPKPTNKDLTESASNEDESLANTRKHYTVKWDSR